MPNISVQYNWSAHSKGFCHWEVYFNLLPFFVKKNAICMIRFFLSHKSLSQRPETDETVLVQPYQLDHRWAWPLQLVVVGLCTLYYYRFYNAQSLAINGTLVQQQKPSLLHFVCVWTVIGIFKSSCGWRSTHANTTARHW